MSDVRIAELNKLPYIVKVPNEKQVVHMYPFFDEDKKQFINYFPNKNGEFMFLYSEPVEAFYYSKSKLGTEKDLFIDFFDVLIRKYSYRFTTTAIESVSNDILNLSAIFEKYFVILNYISSDPREHKLILIKTEIEYFFGVIRSLYDLLQNVIKQFVKEYMKKELSDSFARMFDDKTLELKSKYIYLPSQLINYYNSSANFFFKCRDIRNGIHHFGYSHDFIYHFNEGFAIHQDLFSFSEFNIWPHDKIKENNLVSLLALFVSRPVNNSSF